MTELAEAEAVGVEAAEARKAVLKQEGGVSALERARRSLHEALAAHKSYVDCKKRLDAMQTTVSDANWEFENVVARVPWHPTTTEYRQPRRIAAAMYKPYGDLILRAARVYYRLRYGLAIGRLDECRRALPACESLAQETLRLIADLRDDKYVGTPAIWRVYHPITPRLREFITRCEELTKPLEVPPG